MIVSSLIFTGKENKNDNNNNGGAGFYHILSRSEGDVRHSVASDHVVAKHVGTVNTEHELWPCGNKRTTYFAIIIATSAAARKLQVQPAHIQTGWCS